MLYSKNPLIVQDHIVQLRNRGLVIDNEAEATHYLEHISYYRLAGYWWPMQRDKTNHIFKEKSKFEDDSAIMIKSKNSW